MSAIGTVLGNLTIPVGSWDPVREAPDRPLTYVDLSSIDRDGKEITNPQRMLGSEAPSRARQLLQSGDVLVSTVRPNLNAVAQVPAELDGATGSTGFCVLRADTSRLDGRYLLHWVRSPGFIAEMIRRATGASYPAVSDKTVEGSKIPLPPLAEQQRLAAILDKADAVRRKRQQTLDLADQFLRSAFLDMFGDPVTNPKGWPLQALGRIATITTGNTPSRNKPEYYGVGIEWIKSDNINTPDHFVTRASESLSEEGKAVGRTVHPGATLMTCIAGSRSCIGNVAMADREVAFNQQINALEPHSSVLPEFLYFELLLAKRLIQAASTDSMKGLVSKGRLARVELPIPPLVLQERFCGFFESTKAISARLRMGIDRTDLLFKSSTERAFRGGR